MIFRFVILIFSSLMLSMQVSTLRTHTTVHFKIQYEKSISINDIRELGAMLEDKYSHYRNVFGLSSGNVTIVNVYNSIGRFRAESKTKIFDDGDFKSGKIYFAYPSNPGNQERLANIAARVVARSILDKISACPEWLKESFSLYAGNDLSRFGDPARFNIATFTDLGEDYNRASDPKDIKELFAKLASTVHFLVNRYGESKVELMLKNFKNGGSIEEAFELTFNEKLPEIERAWVKALQNNQRK